MINILSQITFKISLSADKAEFDVKIFRYNVGIYLY